MKTIELKVFEIDELQDQAKKRAIDHYRTNYLDNSFIYDDAHETVKKFNEIFGTSEGYNSWLDVIIPDLENQCKELTSLRLRTWIINNYWSYLFKGKYYGKLVPNFKDGKKIPKSKEYPIGQRHVKRYSNVIFNNDCVLTGVCYDLSMLAPIYEFLEWDRKQNLYYSNLTLEDLILDCFSELKKDIESEIDARNEDEYIIEEIQANNYQYLKNGVIFN